MPISAFLRRFLFHVTAAADVLAILLLLAEFFVPGSILPFIDVVDLLLPLIFLNVVTAFLVPRIRPPVS
ncbi:hypothetical protein KJ781_00925 [Patescibacteria group bacterium]|nr:hypothetical protein [Patescibacteria group bacterium]MBU1448238.1 hypothetical protein [Patescibacteria group bacterium]MBU2613492.1 hypothetical protein [Patescibacteria group bacterium]